MTEFPQLEGRLLVVFDGECGFCNRSIRWMLRRDTRDRLRFAPSSDAAVVELLGRHGAGSGGEEDGMETILVFRGVGSAVEELLVRSNAVLACLGALPQPWPMVAKLARLVPWPARDAGYRLMARWRYRIAGRYRECPISTAEERLHFL